MEPETSVVINIVTISSWNYEKEHKRDDEIITVESVVGNIFTFGKLGNSLPN